MIVQQIDLNLIPGSVPPWINVTQYDYASRTLRFNIYNGTSRFTLTSGITALIEGTKPDGHGFSYSATVNVSNNYVQASLTQQMTIVAGNVRCNIVLLSGNERIGTLAFILNVQRAGLNNDTDTSGSELPTIIDLARSNQEAAAASALESEGWAKGTQNGTAVGSSSPYYQKNSKYYKELAATSATTATTQASNASTSASNASTSATNATNQALKAEGYAIGKQNGTTVASGSPYYHQNAKYYSDQAKTDADRAQSYSVNTPYIGANGNWWIWNTSQGKYVDSGVDASIEVTIADITMLAPTATPYVTNTGTASDPIFHLFIPRGKGISSVVKTSTSGLIDTYTITYSDGATTTYTVANGNGISGISKTSTSGIEDTYTISFTNGTTTTFKVTNGRSITNIAKTSTSGLVDTYTITYNSGNPSTFTVTNGKTAYQQAVDGGYSRSEAQFNRELADFADYADDAVASASAAATSELNALSYKNAAATSATNAATSATSAGNSATAASSSATNAATSATNAASSATAAATSATNAANSADTAQDYSEISEAWAVGTKDDVPVASTESQYNNHSKYWANQSQATYNQTAALYNEMEGFMAIIRQLFRVINIVTESEDKIITEDGNYIIMDL